MKRAAAEPSGGRDTVISGDHMGKYEFIAPCHFGLESVLKQELADLGYEIVQVEDGRVTFAGDEHAFCRAKHGPYSLRSSRFLCLHYCRG